MSLECVSCGFVTNLKSNLARHNLTQRHRELCVVVETPVSLLQAKVVELEKQIVELKHQVELKDVLLSSKDQMIELLKSKKTKHSDDDEPKTKPKKEKETPESADKEIEYLTTKLKLFNNEEQKEFLMKYTTTSSKVKDWVFNKTAETFCTEYSSLANEIIPDDKEQVENVKSFQYKGTDYLLAVDGVVYDVQTEDEIGFYDGEDIIFN